MKPFLTFSLSVLFACTALAQSKFDPLKKLESYNVTWDEPGPSALESMPLGNGDIGLNVWVEPSGDLLFYISKTDAWSENNFTDQGSLLKLGRIRVSLDKPALAPGQPFSQVLRLAQGEILVTQGTTQQGAVFRVWVDANSPTVHVEMQSAQPRKLTVALETWRDTPRDGVSADTIAPNQKDAVEWYHRNENTDQEALKNLTFGGLMKARGLVTKDDKTLVSSGPTKAQAISIYVLTQKTDSAEGFRKALADVAQKADAVSLPEAYKRHLAWWSAFWNRSWIFATGSKEADQITLGYILQRFKTACAGRGGAPIKFNGSIFNVDNPAFSRLDETKNVDADFRTWGGQYWFQNTRAMYWPRLQAGDFDMMLPLFNMYLAQLPYNTEKVKEYYKHDGAYFAETAPFWGRLKYMGPEVPEDWTGHYFSPILELSMMMLDYYDYTGDTAFAKSTLVPLASSGIQFYDEHFKRDEKGKLLIDPVNAIEMYWKVHNPAPDIAGLRAILPRMIALPDGLVTPAQRTEWKRLLAEIPELPVGERNGKTSLLPYTGPQDAKARNGENPELYAIYPFRLYGVDQPDLKLAKDSFETRRHYQKGCWVQDPIQAAMLGLDNIAAEYTHFALTRQAKDMKFPAFWAAANDYAPDEDNGGNGENGLQQMLLQANGKKILLLPAWPKNWSAEFKLNAPYKTTVEGRVEKGKLVSFTVSPMSRKADVVDMSK